MRNQTGALRQLKQLVVQAEAKKAAAVAEVAALSWDLPARRAAAAGLLHAEAALREAHDAQSRVAALLLGLVLRRGQEAQAAVLTELSDFVHEAINVLSPPQRHPPAT